MVRLKDDGGITAKIIDLGLAKSLDEPGAQTAISTPGAFAGTPYQSSLDFQTDRIVQSTFCQVLEKLSGSDVGWRAMTQIYERKLARAEHQS
jgi:hypothetical protein